MEQQAAGQADWDSGLNDNFSILDRGFHKVLTAGEEISSGHVIWHNGTYAFHYNAASLGLRQPTGLAYKSVSSGAEDLFLIAGAVNSLGGVFSGHISVGEPVYVDPASPGYPVNSYSAAAFPVGRGVRPDSILVFPGMFSPIPEQVTITKSLGLLATGSTHHFDVNLGHRGIVRKVTTNNNSMSTWTLKFFSGSAAVNSERLYETQSGGVTSIFFEDAAPWCFTNTDTSSPGLIFGRVSNLAGVSSGHVNVTIVVERFR